MNGHEHYFCIERGDSTHSWVECACGERDRIRARSVPYFTTIHPNRRPHR